MDAAATDGHQVNLSAGWNEVYVTVTPADTTTTEIYSSKVSGTCNSAQQGALAMLVSCPLQVIDSGQASMGLGLVVLAAAEAAMRGAGQSEVVSTARSAARRAQCLGLLETLEFLQRGGRIGRAQALVGSALEYQANDHRAGRRGASAGRARTFPRVLAKMQETVRGFAPLESLAVMHSTTPNIAARVADDLRDVLPEGAEPRIARFGPALGVYAGTGALGIALIQAEEQAPDRGPNGRH